MAEPILKLTRGVPRTDREWMDVFKNLTRFFRVRGDELVIGGDIVLPDQSVGTSEIQDLAVTDPKLRASQGCSVIGRSLSSSGSPADIQASSDGMFLRRAGGVLGFDAIVDADIPGTIARDTEVTTAISNHEAAADPHPGYTTAAELAAHSGAADPHTVYPLAAGAETISGAWTFTASLTQVNGRLLINRDSTFNDAGGDDVGLDIHTASDSNKHLWLGYDPTLNAGFIQATEEGTAHRPLYLNPNGGAVVFSSPVQLPSYTVATLPTVGTATLIYVSNETGGAVLAFSDGTNWRRVTDRAIVA